MLKKILLASIFAITAITNVTYAEDDMKTVASKAYVDTQIETKQLKIPAAGQPNVGAGETVMTYTATGNGQIGERGLYSDISSYDATTDGDKLITASALNATFTNLPTTPTTKLECANQADGCTLWTIVDQTAYGDMLPSGYTRLEYIQSTGTQYIDTGVAFSTTDVLETELMVTNLNATKHMISTGGTPGPSFFQIAQTSTLLLADFGTPATGRVSITEITSVDNKVSLKANAATKEFYVNNNLVGSASNSDFIGSVASVKLFSATGEPYIRTYSFKIVGKINLIPARRNSDNVLGMYDTISGTFFTNAATSGPDFTAGPVAN